MLHTRITTEEYEGVPVSQEERRLDERFVTVLKVGRAVINGHDQLCLIRNMSRQGAKVDVRHPLTVDERVTIELRSDKVVSGTVRWSGDHVAGILFDKPVDVDDLLKPRQTRSVLRRLPRAPRFLCDGIAYLEQEESVSHGVVSNISLHGACIETELKAKIEDHMTVRIEGLPPRAAAVRWVAPHLLGVHFDLPMGYSDLARWLDAHGVHHDPALDV